MTPKPASSGTTLRLRIRSAGAIGILLALATFGIHGAAGALGAIFDEHVMFHQVAAGQWQAELNHLQNGAYFLSMGRPRSICSIRLDGIPVAKNGEPSLGTRDQLLLGTSFYKTALAPRRADIECAVQEGFTFNFTSRPLIAKRAFGQCIHALRGFTQTLLGPSIALILIVVLLQAWLAQKAGLITINQGSPDFRRGRTHATLVFASVAFTYSLSLAHWPRLWLDGLAATVLHVTLRSVYAFALYWIWAAYSKRSKSQEWLHIFQAATLLVLACWKPADLVQGYKLSFIWFEASALLSFIRLQRDGRDSGSSLMGSMAVAYLLIVPVDYMASFLWETENVSPGLLAILCLGVLQARIQEEGAQERAEFAVRQISQYFGSHLSLVQLVQQIAALTGRASEFKRVSAYVDGYLCGASGTPGSSYVRVFCEGYDSPKDKGERVVFDEGYGRRMQQALQSGHMICDRGLHDGAWYLVLPLGGGVCVNISDDRPASLVAIERRLRVVHLMLPALMRLEERVSEHSVKLAMGLERLRQLYGFRTVEQEIAALFVDIDRYSTLTLEYGDQFSRFVSDVYLPAILKHVGHWANPEYMRGDEVYFVCVPDLLPDNTGIDVALANAIRAISAFSQGDGRRICSENGYPALSVKMGAAFGLCSIVCDSIKVRTAGQAVNHAKRLMDYAGEGEILLKQDKLSDRREMPGIHVSAPITVAQKRDIFLARRLRVEAEKPLQALTKTRGLLRPYPKASAGEG